jgi:hypothetical protein
MTSTAFVAALLVLPVEQLDQFIPASTLQCVLPQLDDHPARNG